MNVGFHPLAVEELTEAGQFYEGRALGLGWPGSVSGGITTIVSPLEGTLRESHMARLLLLALLVVSSSASAIVIRDDVDDSEYRVPASDFPALVDMPGEGHGVLISPQWVITAAHAIMWQSEIKHIVLNGTSREPLINRT